jgi:hypothetical protein
MDAGKRHKESEAERMAEGLGSGNNPSASTAAIPQAEPDAELVACCRAFVSEVARREELWRRAVTIEIEEIVESEIACGAAEHRAMLDRLCRLPARTPDGLRAKASVLAAAEPAFLRGQLEGSEVGGRILASLLRDLLG